MVMWGPEIRGKKQNNCLFFLFYSKSVEYMVGYIFLITFVSDFALLYIVLIHLKKKKV